jgi:hypothetical protein
MHPSQRSNGQPNPIESVDQNFPPTPVAEDVNLPSPRNDKCNSSVALASPSYLYRIAYDLKLAIAPSDSQERLRDSAMSELFTRYRTRFMTKRFGVNRMAG